MIEATRAEGSGEDPELVAAREDAEAALRDVKDRLDSLSESGRQAITRVKHGLYPIALGAGGALVLLTLALLVRRAHEAPRSRMRRRRGALLASFARVAALAVARAVLRRLLVRAAERVADRLVHEEDRIVVAEVPAGG